MKKAITFLFFLLLLQVACNAESGKSQSGNYGPTALHKAAYNGNIKRVKAILATKPEKDVRDSFGGTALHAAMFQDDIEIVKLLIDYGLNIDIKGTSNGYTPLHDAVWANNLKAVKLLIKKGADTTIKNKNGQTALDKAKSEGKSEIVKYLESIK